MYPLLTPYLGQVHRTSVMDRFNFPDLTEFVAGIEVIVRGCETGALRDKGFPPNSLLPLIPMPPRERKELFDKVKFSL